MATLQLLKEQKSKIESIMNQYGARDIRVFGSVARMEDSKNSDIDFWVGLLSIICKCITYRLRLTIYA